MIRKDDRMLSRQTQIKPSLSTYIIIHPVRASPTARMQMNSWALTPSKSHCPVTFVAPFFCFVPERWGKNCSGVETWGFWPVLRDGLGCWTQAEAQGRWQCCERGCCPAKSIDSSLNFASLEQAMGHWYWFGWGLFTFWFSMLIGRGSIAKKGNKTIFGCFGWTLGAGSLSSVRTSLHASLWTRFHLAIDRTDGATLNWLVPSWLETYFHCYPCLGKQFQFDEYFSIGLRWPIRFCFISLGRWSV